ncbi:hypothetical protein BP5796_08822 [Coleophoma crateriformis]|uniref:Cytochrome P450 n=1 Tax=Coleophoma crateriformis TaxID=565419 RepID=A0A3D8R8T3_9HELO|nr:hypothetical protein BP5796_08822 [Coleophoma crateriformis]
MSVLSLATGTLLVALTWLVLDVLLPLRRNINVAKASGLKYVVVPWYGYNRLTTLLLSRTVLRFFNALLPAPGPTSWRRLISSNWPWKVHYAPFEVLGSDTFLTVAPGGMILNTADANVINQITSRGGDFPKPTHLYKSVDIYGKNVVSSEGLVWKRHRKLVAPSFSECNNHLVWKETLEQTQEMLKGWDSKSIVRRVGNDTKILSLNVISKAGLGRKMKWPSEVEDGVSKLGEGHRMSFSYSLHYLLTNVFYVMVLPKWILKLAPFSKWRKAYKAYYEWAAYMDEIFAEKEAEVGSSQSTSSTVDIIGQLVKGQEENASQPILSPPELLGNLFVLIFAGHETSASSIHFSLLLLAMHPDIQRTVQDSLAEILSSRLGDPSLWNYEHDLPKMLNSMLGAVLNEELRLIPPTITVPKMVNPASFAQTLVVDEREVQIPGGTMIRLCIPSVHQNPKFWPRSSVSNGDHSNKTSNGKASQEAQREDLASFRPDRWIASPSSPSSPGSTESLYTPPKGSYIPFSDGQRACLGRRFAQVEILACLAVILSQYSVELCPSIAPGEIEGEGETEGRRIAAVDDAWRVLRTDLTLVITVQLKGKGIPLRFVRREKCSGS